MTENFGLIWAVLLLPLAGFLLLCLAGSRLEKLMGRRLLGAISVLPIALAFGVGAFLTSKLAGLDAAHRFVVVGGPQWIDILGLRIPFELTVDPLSMTMTLIITGIGALIFLYSTGYMATEREYSRFFAYLNLFAASMLLLVLANNLALLFVGWEGVGLCSYLLIGFWYKDLPNAKAANKAFIVNRIGDWGLMLGIFTILVLIANSNMQVSDGRLLSYDVFRKVLSHELVRQPELATAAALLLFVGAAGKSAQFPLYLWLPDAMAGPTPVSALIHAATMVTSGVVLLNRMQVVFQNSPVASTLVCALGAFTAIYAAIIAFGQTDIKRVLAYSTVSQLGFMFIGCGAGAYWAGMFHVTTHAFFKALLFLGAGAVIHAMSHDQDMRHYGNLKKYLPITFWTMVIGWLAISAIGIPGVFGFSGFYSKEALLGPALGIQDSVDNGAQFTNIAGSVGLFTALLTAAYMTRLTLLTFFGKERWRDLPVDDHIVHHHEPLEDLPFLEDPNGFYFDKPLVVEEAHDHALTRDHQPKEVGPSMWIPLVVLAILAAFGGFFLSRGDLFKEWLAPLTDAGAVSANDGPTWLPLISTVAAVSGLILGFIMVRSEKFEDSQWSRTRLWIRRQFGFDDALTTAAVEGGHQFGVMLDQGIEAGVLDRIVNGLAYIVGGIGGYLSQVQKGIVRSYALLMLLGGLLIVAYMTFGAQITAGREPPRDPKPIATLGEARP